jgi:hypothetical protein
LKISGCHGGPNQSWVLRQGVDLTYEENAWRTGNTIREFNLPAADFKLCQKSCIEDRHCTAWGYRKPEGRTDRQPHCWLANEIVKIERGSKENLVVSGSVRSEAPKPPGK